MKSRSWSDWGIALSVIFCSVVLLGALAFALSGSFIGTPSQVVHAEFADVTGISVHSAVKFAGATAGSVAAIEWLSDSERNGAAVPGASVRLSLALNSRVPRLREGAVASISADTILSDKFVQIEPGPPGTAELSPDSTIPGITPASFDQLVRNADSVLGLLSDLAGNGPGEFAPFFQELLGLVDDAKSALAEVAPLLADFRSVAGDARGTLSAFSALAGEAGTALSENREPLTRSIEKMESAATALEQLAKRGDALVSSSAPPIGEAVAELNRASREARVATTYLKILALRLAQNPSHLLWSRPSPVPIPSQEDVLSEP